MRMEPTESSKMSAINVTWTPGTYPKDSKLQCAMLFATQKVQTWKYETSKLYFVNVLLTVHLSITCK